MKSWFVMKILCLLVLLGAVPAPAADPSAATRAEPTLLAAARQEKDLVIYAAIDKGMGESLVKDFNSLYPGIKVYLVELTGVEVFNSYMFDQGKRRESADLLWSSEVGLQAELVKDGYAQQYRSGESGAIFPWANLNNLAYATAHEPVVMVYNRKLLAEKDLPVSHKSLLKAVGEERFEGKIATCDPEKNGRAFFFLAHDQTSGFSFWNLVKGFGAAGLQIYPDYPELLDKVATGEAVLGYNVPAGEAFRRAKADPAVGVFYPGDYTLSMPQTILIAKGAPHPNAARLWIDYILSARGQGIIAQGSNLFPVRGDAAGGAITGEPLKLPGARGLRVMMPAGEITRFNEQGFRRGFVLRWKERLNLVK